MPSRPPTWMLDFILGQPAEDQEAKSAAMNAKDAVDSAKDAAESAKDAAEMDSGWVQGWLATNQARISSLATNPMEEEEEEENLSESTNTENVVEIKEEEEEEEEGNTGAKEEKVKKERINYGREVLRLVCGWWYCGEEFSSWLDLQEHVTGHLGEVGEGLALHPSLPCRWQGCTFSSAQFPLHRAHLHLHTFHTKLASHGAALLARRPNLSLCKLPRQPLVQGKPLACWWRGCDERLADSPEGLVDSAGALVEVVQGTLHWVQPMDFYIHVSAHAYEAASEGCAWRDCSSTPPSPLPSKLREHLRVHTGEKQLACPSCGSTFTNRVKAHDHFIRKGAVAADPNSQLKCEDCDKTFPSERLLKNHKRVHLKQYPCSQCDMMCTSPSTLKYHIHYRHSTEKNYSCEVCDYKGKTPADIKSHMRIHDETRSLIPCKFGCGLAKKAAMTLKKHYWEKHGEQDEMYSCHECNKMFSRGNKLMKHMETNHGIAATKGTRLKFKKHPLTGIFYLEIYLQHVMY